MEFKYSTEKIKKSKKNTKEYIFLEVVVIRNNKL